jgi:tetratricopeptide (TPR) repeat protein
MADLAAAETALAERPDDPDAAIWVGRRLAYLGDYRGAIAAFTRGIERHPRDHRFYRHRGHRWITVRRFDRALSDLERAAKLSADLPDEVEPDGMPNAAGIPRGTTRGNVWYHLGLARYLKGDFDRAADAWREALALSQNDDTLVATTHWLFLALCRAGRIDEATPLLAPIGETMDILENRAYLELALVYRGLLSEEDLVVRAFEGDDAVDRATIGYGIASLRLCRGDRTAATELLRRVVAGPMWPAFGHIAAEVDLARLGQDTD